MELPNVITEQRDPELNFTFAVRAYRKVTEYEMRAAFTLWRRQKKSNKPKRNQRVEIISIIGHNQ